MQKKLIKWVVRIEVDQSIWFCRLSPNAHILAIYLEFDLLPNGNLKRFVEWYCEDDDICLFRKPRFLGITITIGLKAQLTHFLGSIRNNTSLASFTDCLISCNCEV